MNKALKQVDFVYVLGDAYVDHPSFGCAIITRTLQAFGYSCAILAQPDWHRDEEFLQFGEPRLGLPRLGRQHRFDGQPLFGEQAPQRQRRVFRMKASWEKGQIGRPSSIRRSQALFPHVPIMIGGIEASPAAARAL